MKKRLIAFLLVLIMVLGMLPASAFAADGDATKYTYTLYYKWNDGTDRTWNTDDTSPTAETSFTHYVNTATLPRNGYQHSGWADEANATTARYTGGEPIVLNKDNPTKTIYAIWLPIFELHYNANGGTGAPDSQTYTSYSATSTQATFTSRNQIPTKDGYTFKGWADSAAATTAQYQPGGTIAVNHADSPKTVYAVWEKNAAPIEYTVTYYKNDGSANDLFYKTSDWGEPSEKFNIYWGKPTRDGYDFVGWAETRDATEAKYASGGAGGKQSWIKLDGPKVLYAVWQEAGLEPEAPRSPSDCKDQLKTNTIKLVCVDGNHPDKVITFADVSYGLDWSMGDTCRLNFYAKDAALKYSGHAPKNPEERIYVTFKWVNNETDANGKYLPGKWVMDETTAAVVKLVDTGVEAPSKPTTAQLGNIKVTCRTNAEHSSEFPVAKCMGTTVGTVTFDSVKKQWYIDTAPMTTQLASRYDSWKGYAEGTHRLVNPDAELNARFYYDGEKWYTEDTLAIDVCCGAVSEIPGKPDMNQFLGNVLIRCTTDCSTHAEKGRKNIYSNTRDSSMYTEVLDGNGDAIWKDNDGVWTYQIKLIRAKFVEAYSNNRFIKYPHTDTAPNEETILTWKYKNGAWELIKLPGYTEVATIIEVKCAEIKEPTREDIFKALNGLVTVTCINRFWKDGNKNMDCGQGQYAAKAGIAGQEYTLEKGENAGTWVVTFPVTNFVKSFKQNPAHNLYTKDTLSWYIRWENNAWTSAPVEPGVDDLVKLTHAPTDWREVAKIATGGKSDCIHVSCVNGETGVCDYGITVPFVYSATDVVSVEPEDGVPGSYIATFKVDRYIDTCAKACNDKNFPDAPRTHKLLTQETVQWRLYATSEADEKIGNNVLNHVWAADPVTPGTDDVCTVAHNWVVTFDPANGGDTFTQDVEYEGKATEPAAPEKTGYTFDGWYEAQKDIGTASHKLNALSIAKKWELYGRYTAKTDVSYTVKYLREGDNKVLAPEKVVTDQTFDTEVTEQAADVVGYTPDAPSKTMILDEYNKVLTFSYSANTYDYTVRHIKQLPDGSYDEANAEVETLSGKFEALAAVTAKDYGEHYPTNDADTKQNIKIEEGLTIDVKYDLDEHTLTFETNGGSAINPVTVRHGNAVARPADPTKDKYTFIGWYADPEFTEEYDFATVLEADKTIYAKFELTSTPIGDIYVRYDVLHIKQLPDGTYDLANAEVEHLSAKKDTTVTAVIKDYRATHHVNVNRTLSKLTGTAIQPYKGVDGKPVYTILSVYYDLDFHTLTFDTMGGSKIAPETVRHGLTVAKPKDPVNGGYIFDGWYTDKTYRTPYNFATPLTQDTTIYAKWFLIVLPGVTDKKATPKLNTSDHFAYVQGYPNGTVKPAGNITRAETAAILFRLMDDASRKTYYSTKSGFRDVASGSWYNTYVATLNNAGVITDSSNGYFRPNEAITRAELAAMLAKFSETTGAANYFNDVSAKYWAANAIAICAKLGWINGYPDGTFRPDKNVTRAELMAMINRATGRAPKSADAFLPGMKTWIDNTSDKWYYLDVQEATNSHSYTVKGSETWTALTSDPNWSLYE